MAVAQTRPIDTKRTPPMSSLSPNVAWLASLKTTDEMLQLIVSYLPYQEGDENLKLE